LLAHGWWFSPVTPASSTTKTDIAEILLKVALGHQNISQSNQPMSQLIAYMLPIYT
jgi:hypothetical protein